METSVEIGAANPNSKRVTPDIIRHVYFRILIPIINSRSLPFNLHSKKPLCSLTISFAIVNPSPLPSSLLPLSLL